MILTQNRIEDVLRTGTAQNSTLAERFIREVKRRFGIHVEACYLQSDTHIDLPSGASFAKFIRTEPVPFVREQILTVYTDSRLCCPFTEGEAWHKDALFSLLTEILREKEISVESPRAYLSEEMSYYGWNHTKRENWDYSCVVKTAVSYVERHSVFIESIDQLALWQYLQDSLPMVRRCPAVRRLYAKVFCGYDSSRKSMAYFLVLPDRNAEGSELETVAAEFSGYVLDHLRHRDKWGVITSEIVTPVVTDYASLSPEQKWSLAKE